MLKGNTEFNLMPGQKLAYQMALSAAKKASPKRKKVVIIEGGPGTGKSVIAINLLDTLVNKVRIDARYVTKSP